MSAVLIFAARRSPRPGLLPRNPVPYLPNKGALCDGLDRTAMPALIFWISGSGVSSPPIVSAGDDSAPETSEYSSGSKGFLGVVKEGFRNGGAVLAGVVMNDLVDFADSKFAICMLADYCLGLRGDGVNLRFGWPC